MPQFLFLFFIFDLLLKWYCLSKEDLTKRGTKYIEIIKHKSRNNGLWESDLDLEKLTLINKRKKGVEGFSLIQSLFVCLGGKWESPRAHAPWPQTTPTLKEECGVETHAKSSCGQYLKLWTRKEWVDNVESLIEWLGMTSFLFSLFQSIPCKVLQTTTPFCSPTYK